MHIHSCVIAGDFNLVLKPEIDTKDCFNIKNPNARGHVVEMIIDLNLVDVWRELNIEARQYTWRRKNTNKQTRLDFFLISENIFTDVDHACILPGYRTDHSMIKLIFEFGKFKKGPSYWKMNNSSLKDSLYINEIKQTINDTITSYS